MSPLEILIIAKDQASRVLAQVQGAMGKVNDGAKSLAGGGLKYLGDSFTKVGDVVKNGFLIGMTGAVGAFGLAMVKTNEFNASMANVASLMPGSTARVKELGSAVQQIAINTGQSTADISAGLYQVISAFGDSADAVKILEINAKSAMAGLATTAEAINLTSAVTKAYGDTSAEAVLKASDLAIMTVRLGQTTFPELAASVGKVTPLMKQLGGSQEELFAIMATMTGVTGTAADVSTQLRGALQSLMAPTKSATATMSKMGFANGAAMVKSLGVQGSLKALADTAKKTNQPLQNFISSIEGQVLALGLVGPQADDYRKKLAAMSESAGATYKAFAEQTTGLNSFGWRLKQLGAVVEVLAQKFGDKLAPAMSEVVKVIIENLEKINVDYVLGKFEKLFSYLNGGTDIPTLFGLDQSNPIFGVLEDLRGSINFVKVKFDEFKGNTDLVNATLVGLASTGIAVAVAGLVSLIVHALALAAPFVAIGLVVGALYYGWTTNFGGMQTKLTEFWGIAQPVLAQFGDYFITTLMPAIQGFATGAWQKLMDGFTYLTTVIWPLIQPVLVMLGDMFMTHIVPPVMELGKSLMELWNVIQPYVIPALQVLAGVLGIALLGAIVILGAGFKTLIEGIKLGVDLFVGNIKNMENAWNTISQALGTANTFVQNSWNTLKAGAEGVFGSISGFFQTTWDKAVAMKDGIVGAFNSIGSGMANGLKSALNIAIDNLNRGISSVNGLIASIPEIPGVGAVPQIPQIPRLAKGGNVRAGQPYIVGDNPDGSLNRTSELFIPSGSGRVLSADNTRRFLGGGQGQNGGGNITINIQNLNLQGVQNPREFAEQMKKASRQGLLGFRNGTRTA